MEKYLNYLNLDLWCYMMIKYVQTKRDDNRVTKVGHFIRKTSIDELPQFINVIIGDMSIVGPRPTQFIFIKNIILN